MSDWRKSLRREMKELREEYVPEFDKRGHPNDQKTCRNIVEHYNNDNRIIMIGSHDKYLAINGEFIDGCEYDCIFVDPTAQGAPNSESVKIIQPGDRRYYVFLKRNEIPWTEYRYLDKFRDRIF